MDTRTDYMKRGLRLLAEEKWGLAVREFEGALGRDPDDPEVLTALAHALWNDGVSDGDHERKYRAMQGAERALQRDSSNADAVRLVTHMTEHPDTLYRKGGAKKTAPPVVVQPRRSPLIIAAIGAIIAMGSVIFVFIGGEGGFETGEREDVATYTPEAEDSFAQPSVQFGKKGVGAGYFTDARSIAADDDGRLYVGEYESGRVQVFASDGDLLATWQAPGEGPLHALEVAGNGELYVVRDRGITRVTGVTGEVIGRIDYDQGEGFQDIAVKADGGAVALWRGMRREGGHPVGLSEDMIFIPRDFSKHGAIDTIIENPVHDITARHTTPRVALSGDGTIYILDRTSDAVYLFDRTGRYLDRFGENGSAPGEFQGASDIAVTNQGEVLVSDAKGVQVFSKSGGYIALIDVEGSARDLDVQGEMIWVAVRDGVEGWERVGR